MINRRPGYIPPGAALVFTTLFLALGWGGYAGARYLLAPSTALESYHEKGMSHVALARLPPRQAGTPGVDIPLSAGVTLRSRADFEMTGLVLGASRYRWDSNSDISPVDLALGWGAMSVPEIVEDFRIRQSRRFYFWSTERLPIPQREVIASSANMHMIPANDEIRDRLLSVRGGDVVRIRGELVDVKRGQALVWQTSLTRRDSGDGACEVIHVRSLEILRGTETAGWTGGTGLYEKDL